MKTTPRFDIYVVNPDDGQLTPVGEWKNDADPTRAELAAIFDPETGSGLYISKKIAAFETFDKAQTIAEAYKPENQAGPVEGHTFRNPTRRECIDIYDVRFQGLDDALALIGGDEIPGHWYWTNEPHPIYSTRAFIFYGGTGSVGSSTKYGTYLVRPVSAFHLV